MQDVDREFTLEEARTVLDAARSLAPGALAAPFSFADIRTVVEAGAEVKDIALGLLDFPTTIQGVPAYWCWKAGEDAIEWWHPRDTGFSGRQHIDDLPPQAL